jgi:hypothetical protein
MVQDLDFLLPSEGGMAKHRIGVPEQAGRVVQSTLRIDLVHLDLSAA